MFRLPAHSIYNIVFNNIFNIRYFNIRILNMWFKSSSLNLLPLAAQLKHVSMMRFFSLITVFGMATILTTDTLANAPKNSNHLTQNHSNLPLPPLTSTLTKLDNLQLQQAQQLANKYWQTEQSNPADSLHHQAKQLEQANIPIPAKELIKLNIVEAMPEQLSAEQQSLLHDWSHQKSTSLTALTDGAHQQWIIAFPFAETARARLNRFTHYQLAQQTQSDIESGFFETPQLASLMSKDSATQAAIFSIIREDLSKQAKVNLLSWAIQHKQKLLHSSPYNPLTNAMGQPSKHTQQSTLSPVLEMMLAVDTQNTAQLIQVLTQTPNLPLQHEFFHLRQSWPQAQQLDLYLSLTTILPYASQAVYQIEKLDILPAQKQTIMLSLLKSDGVGSTAAHILAQSLTPQLADQLIQQLEQVTAPILDSKTDFTLIKNIVLAFSLSDKADEYLPWLIAEKKLPATIAQEVKQWLN
ncbi:hypothetical protein [Aliikangiella maris]|uniref:Uncharacterized protein n=2 Tax=Aliikangiella maris TaxID=3162458 RepID=A0ABV3MSM9_9GAMM